MTSRKISRNISGDNSGNISADICWDIFEDISRDTIVVIPGDVSVNIFFWIFLRIVLGNVCWKFCGNIYYTTVIWLAVSILKGCSNSGGD